MVGGRDAQYVSSRTSPAIDPPSGLLVIGTQVIRVWGRGLGTPCQAVDLASSLLVIGTQVQRDCTPAFVAVSHAIQSLQAGFAALAARWT
jgi:acetyl-CoA acetyltransferase